MSTYWNNAGTHQNLYHALHAQIPHNGPCPKHLPKLEKLRKASNAYYQLHNNGNAADFYKHFKVSGKAVLNTYETGKFDESASVKIAESKLDTLILEAAAEAGLLKG